METKKRNFWVDENILLSFSYFDAFFFLFYINIIKTKQKKLIGCNNIVFATCFASPYINALCQNLLKLSLYFLKIVYKICISFKIISFVNFTMSQFTENKCISLCTAFKTITLFAHWCSVTISESYSRKADITRH